MKKILLFLLFLLSLQTIAQDTLPKFILTHTGVEPIVLHFDGLTAQEINKRSLQWFQTIYQDPNKSSISTNDMDLIRVNGSIEKALAIDIDGNPVNFDIDYALQIHVMENKATLAIEIGQLWWHPFSRRADFTCQRFFQQDGQPRKLFVHTREQLENSINRLVEEFYHDVKIGSTTRTRQTQDTSRIFVKLDKNAEPHSGFPAFYEFLSNHVHYPEHARRSGISGKVIFKFVIEPDGSLTNFEIVRGLFKECDDELIRVLRLCPNWIPGELKGKKVRQAYTMPFDFKLQ